MNNAARERSHDSTDPRAPLWPLVAIPVVLWAVQGMAGWAIASRICLRPDRFGSARVAVAVVTILFIVVAVASFLVARRYWHVPRGASEPTPEERARYVAGEGLFFSILLGLGLLFALLPSLILGQCGWAR